MKVPDFVRAVERIDVFGNKIDDLIQPLHEREGRSRERLDESGTNAVALSMPLVLLRDGAADAVEASIECAVAIERAHEAAKQGRDCQRVVEPGAAVGDPQLERRIP